MQKGTKEHVNLRKLRVIRNSLTEFELWLPILEQLLLNVIYLKSEGERYDSHQWRKKTGSGDCWTGVRNKCDVMANLLTDFVHE